MCPCGSVVFYAVAFGVRGYEGLLLTSVEFAFGWVYGVCMLD